MEVCNEISALSSGKFDPMCTRAKTVTCGWAEAPNVPEDGSNKNGSRAGEI